MQNQFKQITDNLKEYTEKNSKHLKDISKSFFDYQSKVIELNQDLFKQILTKKEK